MRASRTALIWYVCYLVPCVGDTTDLVCVWLGVHKCYNFGHGLFLIYLSLTSLFLIRASSSFCSMISFLRHYNISSVLDLPLANSSCTRMTSSYVMRRQPASLICP